MDKYVYKITNNINGKVYIGQTNNLKRRIQEHKHDKRNHHPIHFAIERYGFENFSVEVMYYGPDYNRIEKELIIQYDSRNKDKGYNIVSGGQDSSGEDNPAAILTEEKVIKIKHDILYSALTFNEIAEKYNESLRNVYHINQGESFGKSDETYPLRDVSADRKKLRNNIDNIICDLKSNMSLEDICTKYFLNRYTLLNINSGKTYRKSTETYPIRELFLPKNTRENIIYMLKESSFSVYQIAALNNVNKACVYNLNMGKTWKDPNTIYPIRKLESIIKRNELD